MRFVEVEGPLDLRSTLGPLTLTWGRFDSDGWWRPMRTPVGPATLNLVRTTIGVRGTAWGPGAGWVLGRIERLCGLEDDPSTFQTDHPLIAPLHRRSQGARFGATGLVFDALVWAILGQKVTGKEAKSSLRGLVRSFSDPAPGPKPIPLPPDPDRIAGAPYHALHPLGIEKRRADVLRDVASHASRLEAMVGVDAVTVRTALERRRGIGVWTSAETVVVSHGDADALSVGDFHLKHLVAWHLTGEPRGTDERMVDLLEEFRPHRARVTRLLERLGPYPRYGPRQPVRNFAAH